MADAIREFNEYVRQDPRVDVLALPFRDGVNIVTRRYACLLPFATLCTCIKPLLLGPSLSIHATHASVHHTARQLAFIERPWAMQCLSGTAQCKTYLAEGLHRLVEVAQPSFVVYVQH